MWTYAIELAKREHLQTVQHIISIAALRSSMHSIWLAPATHLAAAHAAMGFFADPSSDHLTELNALYAYAIAEDTIEDRADLNEWCRVRFLNRRSLDDVLLVSDMCFASTGVEPNDEPFDGQIREDIRRVLARSFFRHIAVGHDASQGYMKYRTVHGNVEAGLAVDSVLNTGRHWWIVYDKFTIGQNPYLVKATTIDPAWVAVRFLI